mgnify:CR=1 FL=1
MTASYLKDAPGVRKARALAYFGSVIEGLIDQLQVIEVALQEVDVALDQAQPPHTGRIRLMWVGRKARGWREECEPQAVRWLRSRSSGKWRAVRLPVTNLVRRQVTTGEFEHGQAEVRDLLGRMATLLTLHAAVRGRLARLDGEWTLAHPHVARRAAAAALGWRRA